MENSVGKLTVQIVICLFFAPPLVDSTSVGGELFDKHGPKVVFSFFPFSFFASYNKWIWKRRETAGGGGEGVPTGSVYLQATFSFV